MLAKNWNCIGVMSGTSLDGVDIAHISFLSNKTIEYTIHETVTIPYSSRWKDKLTSAFDENRNSEVIQNLNIEYGHYLGKIINDFIKENKIIDIDFIASHGHTIFHNPNHGYTVQIGDGQTIAETTKQKVICDFRSQDVALGGQGAPLVPIGDQLLFSKYDYCINIGGFANVSFQKGAERLAFDICPANIVLNHYTRSIGLEYDDEGKLAKTGRINKELLAKLDQLSFYNTKNSMGNEQVGNEVIPLINSFELDIKDILRTYVEHIAIKISNTLESNSKLLITGGGVFNSFLINRIEHHSNTDIVIPNTTLINYKEALIFGLLGILKLEKRVNVLASVTKASTDHTSGIVFTPKML